MSVSVRRHALETDLDELTDLFEGYRAFYHQPPNAVGARAFLKERFQQQDSVIFVSVANDRLTGFTQLYPIFSSTRMQRVWLLNDLFVHPEYRSLGYGRMLITAAQDYTKQQKAFGLLLETAKTNAPGNHLYPAMGFRLADDVNYYYWEA